MIFSAPLWLMCILLTGIPALAQMSPLDSAGDFRVEGRSGTDPTVGPEGGSGLPPGPAFFRDSLGGKSPDEVLKNIDKELGRSSVDRSISGSGGRPLDMERELRSPADKVFK